MQAKLEQANNKIIEDSLKYNATINEQKSKILALQQEKSKTITINQSQTLKVRKPTTLTEEEVYNLKASYIYNFVKDIEWPESHYHFQISVLNHKMMFEKLKKRLDGKKTGNKHTKVNYISNIEEGSKSQLVFVPSNYNKQLEAYSFKNISPKMIMVSEREEGSPKRCNCINLMMDGNNVDFEIEESILQNNGFKISTQILQLESK
ncbi:MAG: YfiR family protein [Cytophagales bacterium]